MGAIDDWATHLSCSVSPLFLGVAALKILIDQDSRARAGRSRLER